MNNNKKKYNIEVCFHCKFIKSFIMALFLISMKRVFSIAFVLLVLLNITYLYYLQQLHSYYSIHLDCMYVCLLLKFFLLIIKKNIIFSKL